MTTEDRPEPKGEMSKPQTLDTPFYGWKVTKEDVAAYKDVQSRGLTFLFGLVRTSTTGFTNVMDKNVSVYQKPGEAGDFVIVSRAGNNPNDVRVFEITNEEYGEIGAEQDPTSFVKRVLEMADGSGMLRMRTEFADYGTNGDIIETASFGALFKGFIETTGSFLKSVGRAGSQAVQKTASMISTAGEGAMKAAQGVGSTVTSGPSPMKTGIGPLTPGQKAPSVPQGFDIRETAKGAPTPTPKDISNIPFDLRDTAKGSAPSPSQIPLDSMKGQAKQITGPYATGPMSPGQKAPNVPQGFDIRETAKGKPTPTPEDISNRPFDIRETAKGPTPTPPQYGGPGAKKNPFDGHNIKVGPVSPVMAKLGIVMLKGAGKMALAGAKEVAGMSAGATVSHKNMLTSATNIAGAGVEGTTDAMKPPKTPKTPKTSGTSGTPGAEYSQPLK